MDIYKKYSSIKSKISTLNAELKELEPQIFEEIKDLTSPMKTDDGTFTTATTKRWKYSQELTTFDKLMREVVKEKQIKEIEEGKAKYEENQSLRFIGKK